MTEQEKLNEARLKIIILADTIKNQYQSTMWLAQGADCSEFGYQYQRLFMHDIYGGVKGEVSATNQEMIAFVITDDGSAWIKKNCANSYWFWSVIGAACRGASTLPLNVSDLDCGARLLFEDCSKATGREAVIVGWPVGYSGPETPWHFWNSYSRGNLWNNHRLVQSGATHGLLLFQRKPRRPAFLSLFRSSSPHSARIIFNPLFARLSRTAPIGDDSEDLQ